jgi:insulysin
MLSIFNFDININLAINDNRVVRGIILDNNIKLILVSDKDINTSSCCVGVKAGYLQDVYPGCAHFLEHLLFMGSEKFPDSREFQGYVQNCGGSTNAFTSDNMTCYYLELETTYLEKGIELLSWFFRKPLLDMKYIKSEMEIIDSEHQKNILSDTWIMDDIFKKFLNPKSKYAKFGTGNLESLKDITKEDIMNFYNINYTTDNIYVTIIDSKNIEEMIKLYVSYFSDIKIRINKNKFQINDIINNEKLDFINNNNLIIFKSISEYNFLNIYCIIECIEKNDKDYQLVNLLSYLIGSEYNNSFVYYLKENDLAKNINTSIDYFYDVEALLNIKIILLNNDIQSFNNIISIFIDYLEKLSQISIELFREIYENYKKIKILASLYDNKSSAEDVGIKIIENIIRGNLKNALLRNYVLEDYNENIYLLFIEKIEKIKIKFITNQTLQYSNLEYSKSKYYNTEYFITNYNFKNFDKEINFDINNIISIKNFYIKTDILYKIFNENNLPQIIFKNDQKEIYLLNTNKYQKPFSNVVIFRKNNEYIIKENKLLLNIYIYYCENILNYYLDGMKNYMSNFYISFNDEFIYFNFYCLDYYIIKFINEIIRLIDPSTIFCEKNEKYFNKVLSDLLEIYKNVKYNSPYLLNSKYLNFIINDNFKPNEAIEYIKDLKFIFFKNKILDLLKFSKEYFLFVGSFNILNSNLDISNNYFFNLADLLSLNKIFYKKENINFEKNYNIKTYLLKKDEFNPKEINNCVYYCLPIKSIKVNFFEDKINFNNVKKIIKYELMFDIIANLIGEPFFDKIRTTDKLGYIVKCISKHYINKNNYNYLIIYVIQSNFKIDEIYEAINNFNIYFKNDFNLNNKKYNEKFLSIRNSQELDFSKKYSNLDEEVSYYINSIIKKINIFNLKKLYLDIVKKIKFKKVIKYINKIFNNKLNNNFKIVIDIKNNL